MGVAEGDGDEEGGVAEVVDIKLDENCHMKCFK